MYYTRTLVCLVTISVRRRVLLYLPGDHFKRRCFQTKLIRFSAGKREKEAGTELSHALLRCVAGVCFVKRDVITDGLSNTPQTPSCRRKRLSRVRCCSWLGKCAPELGSVPFFLHETSLQIEICSLSFKKKLIARMSCALRQILAVRNHALK